MMKSNRGVHVRGVLSFVRQLPLHAIALIVFSLAVTISPAWAADPLKVGDILVADGNADAGRGAIIKVDPISGAQSIISSGQFFVDPVSLAIKSDGKIIVSDRAMRGLLSVDPLTGLQTVIPTSGLIDPFGIALDANGNIFIADTGWDQITQVNTPGRILRVDAVTGAQTVVTSGIFLSDPWTLAFEPAGTLVVADATASVSPFTGQGGVIRVDPTTGIQAPVSVFQLGPAGTAGCPFGIAVEANGNILTTTFTYPDPPEPTVYGCVPPAIHRVNPVTGSTTTLSAYPTWGWRLPFGIDVDLDGTIIVSDESIKAVFRVNPVDGTPTPLSLFGLFVNPVDVAIVKTAPGGGGNTAPSITSFTATPGSINEGSSTTAAGTFTDANATDSHTVTINWGDGSTTEINLTPGTLSFSASHPYEDDTPSGTSADAYTVTATVTDTNLSDSEATNIVVNNVAPAIGSATGPSGPQAVGTAVNISASFTDIGAEDTHTCSVNWGDSTTSAGSVSESNGTGTCSGTHTYSAPGTYTVRATVTDDDTGATLSGPITVTINAPTAITSLTATTPVNENSSTTLTGAFTDSDASDTHTVTINWGDGSANTVLNLAAGIRNFSTSHQYLDDNPTATASDIYTISVVVADTFGSSNSGNTSVTVKNLAPAISSITGPTGTLAIGSSATINAVFTDAGSKDTHTCVFTWGDSQPNTTVTAAGTGNGSCAATHTYNTAGTFTVSVKVNDDDTGTVTSTYPAFTVQDTSNANKIVFMSTRDSGNPEIYTMNADGTGATRLTNHLAIEALPIWNPTKTKILFSSSRDGGIDLYSMNANGTGVVRLTTNMWANGLASWSPNGAKIAYTSLRDGNFEIYVMNADGTGNTRLTNNIAVDASPTWSPDGTKIAFSTSRDGNYEIYSMNANGSGLVRLTNNSGSDMTPNWSPDGTKIVFSSTRTGNNEIFVMASNGSNVVKLTNHTATDIEPNWSPDGTKIIFTTNRVSSSNYEIYVMKSDGTNLVRLTNNAALETSGDY